MGTQTYCTAFASVHFAIRSFIISFSELHYRFTDRFHSQNSLGTEENHLCGLGFLIWYSNRFGIY